MLGFYSAIQAENIGTIFWLRPDGTEVEVTCVGESTKHFTHLRDLKEVGEVVKWSRMGTRSEKLAQHYAAGTVNVKRTL